MSTGTIKITAALFISILPLSGRAQQANVGFQPDTTINKTLILENPQSVKQFYPAASDLRMSEYFPFVLFMNGTGKQYLLAYHYEGNLRNQYSAFEIGYVTDIPPLKDVRHYNVTDSLFATESGIALGMSVQSLLRLKGKADRRIEEDGTWLVYSLDEQSSLCQRYRMPGYVMKARIEDERVNRIWFGFEYP